MHNRQRISIRSLALVPVLALAASLSTACDSVDDLEDLDALADETLEVSIDEEVIASLTSEPLAEPVVEVEYGDYTLTFLEEVDGSVAVVEYGPTDRPALLDDFMAKDATALEILQTVSPGSEAPQVLVAEHERQTAGAAARGISDFALPPDPVASGEDYNTYYYNTDCSFSADGQSYFDGIWQGWGWDWHWCKYSTPASNILEQSPNTPKRKRLRAHTCNNGSGSDVYRWGVQRVNTTGCAPGVVYYRLVYDGYRAVYYQTNAPQKCRYNTYAVNSVKNVPHSLGLMAP